MDFPTRFSFVSANGIRLHVAEAGPGEGPLAILLHGFPEFWFGWRHQIAPLAEAGFRVVVPDQRGYNLSDKPGRVADYALEILAADVVGIMDALGRARATVVGHDWGGIVAWWVAARHPERVERLIVLNAPHPASMRRAILSNPRQLLRSSYAFAFQVPWLPEALLRRNRWARLCRAMAHSSRPGTFAAEDFEHYRAAWSQPRAITSMIHWYRAGLRHPPRSNAATIAVPTLVIWGACDRFLGRSLAESSVRQCRTGRLELLEDATHWVQHEEAARVNDLITGFAQQ